MVPFHKLKFGWASAEQEGATDPNLLLDGFFDLGGVVEEATNGNKFLFLGYKGSGKSAISEHMRLKAQSDPQMFVTATFLADFPYSDFSRLVRGDDAETKYPTAWSWLLLVKLFDSFNRDQGAASNSNLDFRTAIETLTRLGLLPSPTLKELVFTSSTRTFKVKLPVVFESEFRRDKHEQNLKFPFFVERLKSVASTFKSTSRHLLIIDGLDDILTSAKVQYDSLAALVLEVSRLNAMFVQNSTPAKVLLLCRTDLYEKLPGANKNKIRQDSGVSLDWYHDPRQPGQSNLVRLVNLKARVTDRSLQDVFKVYFPAKMFFRKSNTEHDVIWYLLDFTRHTPRDFIQVLAHIQPFSPHTVYSSLIRRPLTQDQVLSGMRSYSIDYFLPEIKDELVGYFSNVDVNSTIDLIGAMRSREFTFAELTKRAAEQKRFASLDLSSMITALFECSAIGNVDSRKGGTTYYTFKYRNRNSTLNLEDRLTLHRGMWKALNLI